MLLVIKSVFQDLFYPISLLEKISMIEHDSYYKNQFHLTFEERVKTNYDHPLSFDTDLIIEQIKELLVGRPVVIPILYCN